MDQSICDLTKTKIDIFQTSSTIIQQHLEFNQDGTIDYSLLQQNKKIKINWNPQTIAKDYKQMTDIFNIIGNKVQTLKDSLLNSIYHSFNQVESDLKEQKQCIDQSYKNFYKSNRNISKSNLNCTNKQKSGQRIQDIQSICLSINQKIPKLLTEIHQCINQRLNNINNISKQVNIFNQYLYPKSAIQEKILYSLNQNSFFEQSRQYFQNWRFHLQIIIDQNNQDIIKFKTKFLDINNIKINIFDNNPSKVLEVFDRLTLIKPYLLGPLCYDILHEPITERQKIQSNEIENQLIKKLQQISLNVEQFSCIVVGILAYAQHIKQLKFKVIFSRESSFNTQLGLKYLATGFMNKFILVEDRIQESQDWQFEELKSNKHKLYKFCEWYTQKISKEYDIPKYHIYIHQIKKGSIKIIWSTDYGGNVRNVNNQILKLHPFFQYFKLSPNDFEPHGNNEFFDIQEEAERGGWPYYLPKLCKRYGLKVLDRYEGQKKWLQMQGNVGQWAVAFHGAKGCVDNFVGQKGQQQTRLKSILNQVNKGKLSLRPGGGQVFEFDQMANKPNQRVSNGVYFSCFFDEALSYTNQIVIPHINWVYRLVFQCRVHPRYIQVCKSKPSYWVLEPQHIRPYGIILVKKKSYEALKETPQRTFNYQNYRERINEYLQNWSEAQPL